METGGGGERDFFHQSIERWMMPSLPPANPLLTTGVITSISSQYYASSPESSSAAFIVHQNQQSLSLATEIDWELTLPSAHEHMRRETLPCLDACRRQDGRSEYCGLVIYSQQWQV